MAQTTQGLQSDWWLQTKYCLEGHLVLLSFPVVFNIDDRMLQVFHSERAYYCKRDYV